MVNIIRRRSLTKEQEMQGYFKERAQEPDKPISREVPVEMTKEYAERQKQIERGYRNY